MRNILREAGWVKALVHLLRDFGATFVVPPTPVPAPYTSAAARLANAMPQSGAHAAQTPRTRRLLCPDAHQNDAARCTRAALNRSRVVPCVFDLLAVSLQQTAPGGDDSGGVAGGGSGMGGGGGAGGAPGESARSGSGGSASGFAGGWRGGVAAAIRQRRDARRGVLTPRALHGIVAALSAEGWTPFKMFTTPSPSPRPGDAASPHDHATSPSSSQAPSPPAGNAIMTRDVLPLIVTTLQAVLRRSPANVNAFEAAQGVSVIRMLHADAAFRPVSGVQYYLCVWVCVVRVCQGSPNVPPCSTLCKFCTTVSLCGDRWSQIRITPPPR